MMYLIRALFVLMTELMFPVIVLLAGLLGLIWNGKLEWAKDLIIAHYTYPEYYLLWKMKVGVTMKPCGTL